MGSTPDAASLLEEVERLHRKLGELHATDTVALKRAYHALCQHAAALQQDIERSLVEAGGIEVEWVDPTDVAHEVRCGPPSAKADHLPRPSWAPS
jgi:hypothetical protein